MPNLPEPAPVPKKLTPWERDILADLRPPLVIVGLGNPDRGDDGVGVIVARRLMADGATGVLDCGQVPENYLGKVARLAPNDVLFVDAADLGEDPGSIALLSGEDLTTQAVSTHSAGLAPAVEFLRIGLGVRCRLLAVQPARLGTQRGLSSPVRLAAERIVTSPVWRAHAVRPQ